MKLSEGYYAGLTEEGTEAQTGTTFAQRPRGQGEAEPGPHLKRLCREAGCMPTRADQAHPSLLPDRPSPPGPAPHSEAGLEKSQEGRGLRGRRQRERAGVGRGHMCHQPVPGCVQPKLGAESCRFSRISCAAAEGRAEPARGQGRISATDGSSRTLAGDCSRGPGVARAGGDATATCSPPPPGSWIHKQLPHNPHQDGLEARGGPSCVPHDNPVGGMAVPISQMGKLRLQEVQ